MKKKSILGLLVILIIFGLSFCKSDSSKKNAQDQTLEELPEEMNYEEMTYFRFPSPEEIFGFIEGSNIEFIPSIVNEPENYKSYSNSRIQALNLGVYFSDLAYITLFEKREETFLYFTAIHQLCNNLTISAAFTEALLDRVHNNLDNVDSLVSISGDAYRNIINYLVINKKENTLTLMGIGAYVESLFLSISTIEEYSNKNELVQKIADQKYAYENLYNYSVQNLNNEYDKEYIEIIKNIKSVYDKMETIKIEDTKMSKNEDGKLILSGGIKLVMSEDNFNELKEIVTKSRNEIIK